MREAVYSEAQMSDSCLGARFWGCPDSMFSCERPQQVAIITERKTVINQGTSQIQAGNIRWAAHGSLGIPAAGFKMLPNGMFSVGAQGSKQMLRENFPKVSSTPHRRLDQAGPPARSGYLQKPKKARSNPAQPGCSNQPISLVASVTRCSFSSRNFKARIPCFIRHLQFGSVSHLFSLLVPN